MMGLPKEMPQGLVGCLLGWLVGWHALVYKKYTFLKGEGAHETKYMKKKKKDKQNLASRWKRVGLVTLHQPLLSSSCWPVAAWAAPGTPSPGYNAGP